MINSMDPDVVAITGDHVSYPFILYPIEWGWNEEKVVGAEKVYKLFKTKIKETAD